MFECIKESHLSLFSSTADQRYLLGEKMFLNTHYPMELKRFKTQEDFSLWQESDILHELTDSFQAIGNRTFVLYGAAGSGKSEVIRWLVHMLSKTPKKRFMLRISRTELDPVNIMQKILYTFRGIELGDTVHHNWEDLRKKPVTLANHLVWTALGKMLQSDEEIIPLSYKLRPIIEKNLVLNFSGIDNPSEFQERTIELISLEDLETLTNQSAIPIQIDCNQLRYLMTKEFEKTILAGYSFVDTLKNISREIYQQYHVRPILFIDDLVQSMNIYSTELLDYFITMEEGNWDIVFGLTPSSFETSKRGRDILNRISNLDTFDDRLIKLWLSDEQGNTSYFLNTENCHILTEKYLKEFKRLGGYACSQCNSFQACTDLQYSLGSVNLAPFNKPFLKRLFNNLPAGKGKARYFIKTLGEILEEFAKGNITQALQNHIQRELSIDHPDQWVRLVGEAYTPELNKNENIVIPASILLLFTNEYGEEPKEIVTRFTRLSSTRVVSSTSVNELEDHFPEVSIGKSAIRDWLEDKEVNKELLKGLRLGIAHLCREIVQPNVIIPPNTSRLAPLLRWDESIEGSKVPLKIEGIDQFKGIEVKKELGHLAYSLNYLHLKRGQSKQQGFEEVLQSEVLNTLIFDSRIFKNDIKETLTLQLNIPPNELAYLLFVILLEIGQGGQEIPIVLKEAHDYGNFQYPRDLDQRMPIIPEDLAGLIKNLFKDWFILRENIYNPLVLIELEQKYKNKDMILEIFKIDPQKISKHYKINNTEMRKFLTDLQEWLNDFVTFLKSEESIQIVQEFRLKIILLDRLCSPLQHAEFCSRMDEIYERTGIVKVDFLDWQTCSKLRSKIRRKLKTFLDKENNIKFQSTLDRHRVLLIIHQLEGEKDFEKLSTAFRAVENQVDYLHQSKVEVKNYIEHYHLQGYLADKELWTRNLSRECKINWEVDGFVSELALNVKSIQDKKNYLYILGKCTPYINYKLYQDTANVLSELFTFKNTLEFSSELEQILLWCEKYVQTFKRIIYPSGYTKPNNSLINDLTETYEFFQNQSLIDSFRNLNYEIELYIKRIQLLSNNFKLLVDIEKLREILDYLQKDNDSDLVSIWVNKMVSLVPLCHSLEVSINDQLNCFEDKTIMYFINEKEVEYCLTVKNLELLNNIIKRFPSFSENLKLTLHF